MVTRLRSRIDTLFKVSDATGKKKIKKYPPFNTSKMSIKPWTRLLPVFLLAWLTSISVVLASSSQCRCLYEQSCWPNESDFASLSSQLTQSLIHPRPPASACYPASEPSGNCTEVRENEDNGVWRSDQPGSMQAPNFESFIFNNGSISACYLNTTLGIPCEQGSVSNIGVVANSVSDIQNAVKFAVKHNLRTVVKNTG